MQNSENQSGRMRDVDHRWERSLWKLCLLLSPGMLIGFFFGWGVAKSIGSCADALSTDHRDDPVYKKNLQNLIERNRQFEKTE